jgi:hypothetical protein
LFCPFLRGPAPPMTLDQANPQNRSIPACSSNAGPHDPDHGCDALNAAL